MPIFSIMRRSKFYERGIKPVFDRLFALILLLVSLPFQIIIAVVLSFHFMRSPLFLHKRVGRNESTFKLLKFRTFRTDFDEKSMTRLGRFIRSYSLDELPQLLNVLKGDMSLVGPRPLLVEYLKHYNDEEKRRHLVLPGITGLAQVNGRNSINWEERMKLDIFYVNNISFMLDMKILLKTFLEVFKRDLTSYKDEKTITFSEYASKR
ncbi:sugar transferase [Ekhidna sp. MALMAid0563]|uniref:sugar transferase n=1 Tax=Ekhidna sp. MALMAid0563 TaxID=3143937 RepID=UPI0032DF9815